MADDLIVDVPRLWEYLAMLLADTVASSFGLSPVLEALGPAASGPLTCVASILKITFKDRADSPALAGCVPALRAYLGAPPPYQDFLRKHVSI